MESARPYRALTIVLYLLSLVEGLAGLALIFGSAWVMGFVVLPPAAAPVAGLFVLMLKALGILALGLGYLLCVAARDPVRYVAVIDVFVFFLFAAGVLNVYADVALGAWQYFPSNYLLARGIGQIVLGCVLLALRPRVTTRSNMSARLAGLSRPVP